MASKFYAVRKGINPGVYTSWDECSANVKGFPGAEYKSFSSEDDANSYMNAQAQIASATDASRNSKKSSGATVVNEPVLSDSEFDALQNTAQSHLAFLKDNGLILDSLYDQAVRQIDTNIRIRKERQVLMQQRGNKPLPGHVDIFVDGSYNKATNEYGYGVYMTDGEKERILYGRGNCMEGGNNIEGEVVAAKKGVELAGLNPSYTSMTIYHDYQGIGSWADKDWQANKAYNRAYVRFVEQVRERGVDINFVHVDGHTGVDGNEYVDKLAKIGCGIPLTSSEKDFISKLSNVPGYPVTRELPEIDEDPSYTLIGDYSL